jgi:hypothetical protein
MLGDEPARWANLAGDTLYARAARAVCDAQRDRCAELCAAATRVCGCADRGVACGPSCTQTPTVFDQHAHVDFRVRRKRRRE